MRYLKSIFAEGLFNTHIGGGLGKVVGVRGGGGGLSGRSGHTTASTRCGSVGASDGVREAGADDLSVVHANNVGITGIHHS